MPSAFMTALALQASAAVDVVTAEGWTLVPMTAAPETDAPAIPDTSRAGVIVMGTFVDPRAKPQPNAYDVREKVRPGIVAGAPVVLVSPAAFAAAAALAAASSQPFAIRQGDMLTRSADGATWRIASTFPMAGGTTRLAIDLIG